MIHLKVFLEIHGIGGWCFFVYFSYYFWSFGCPLCLCFSVFSNTILRVSGFQRNIYVGLLMFLYGLEFDIFY